MTNAGLIWLTVGGLVFLLLLWAILQSDDDCINHGGKLIVVTEKSKGSLNHTECIYDK